jgi:hypothetical protein
VMLTCVGFEQLDPYLARDPVGRIMWAARVSAVAANVAWVFNPTEIEKNSLATRPAIAPARRVVFLFNSGWVVLTGNGPKLCR